MSSIPYIPVQPYIDPEGRIETIREILGPVYDQAAHTYPKLNPGERALTLDQLKSRTATQDLKHDNLGMEGQWSLSRVSAAVAAQVGYGGLFTSKAEAFGDVLVADALAGYRCVKTQVSGTPSDAKEPVFGTFWGYTLRLVVKVSGFASNTELSLPIVAARAKLGQITAEYSIEGIGGNLETFAAVLRALPTIGEFDMKTYTSISNAAKGVLTQLIAAHNMSPSDTPLLPIQVGIGPETLPQSTMVDAKSLRFAMLCIRNKIKLDEALAFGERRGFFFFRAAGFLSRSHHAGLSRGPKGPIPRNC